MEQLARLAIHPLRIAFDDIHLKDVYCKAVRTAHRHGIKEISNYILFNYKDKPEDLYGRLWVNIELNEELGIQIFSFPMKYSPISETDRTYIGANWCKMHSAVLSGRWCGDQRPLCGPAAGDCQSVEFGFITTV